MPPVRTGFAGRRVRWCSRKFLRRQPVALRRAGAARLCARHRGPAAAHGLSEAIDTPTTATLTLPPSPATARPATRAGNVGRLWLTFRKLRLRFYVLG